MIAVIKNYVHQHAYKHKYLHDAIYKERKREKETKAEIVRKTERQPDIYREKDVGVEGRRTVSFGLRKANENGTFCF